MGICGGGAEEVEDVCTEGPGGAGEELVGGQYEIVLLSLSSRREVRLVQEK